jgi:hypothetical protein
MWAEETAGVAAAGGLSREYHQDLEGRSFEPWVRRAALLILLLFVGAGLLSLFGQTPETIRSTADRAALSLTAPGTVRGGLLYQTQITVTAGPDGLHKPELALSSGFIDGITLNTLEPSPVEEDSSNGNLILTFAALEPGETLTVWLDGQVNPTTVGSRTQHLELREDGDPVTGLSSPVKVLP